MADVISQIHRVAHAYGFRYMSINNHSTRNMVRQALNCPGAVIYEVFMSPDQKTEPRIMSHLVNGRIESDRLENMYPYEN